LVDRRRPRHKIQDLGSQFQSSGKRVVFLGPRNEDDDCVWSKNLFPARSGPLLTTACRYKLLSCKLLSFRHRLDECRKFGPRDDVISGHLALIGDRRCRLIQC